jgi:hypothetical protein
MSTIFNNSCVGIKWHLPFSSLTKIGEFLHLFLLNSSGSKYFNSQIVAIYPLSLLFRAMKPLSKLPEIISPPLWNTTIFWWQKSLLQMLQCFDLKKTRCQAYAIASNFAVCPKQTRLYFFFLSPVARPSVGLRPKWEKECVRGYWWILKLFRKGMWRCVTKPEVRLNPARFDTPLSCA